jgi:gluconate 5-dehydrogenase
MSSLDLFSMAGRVAIVTGGGSGLGRAMAESVAEAGATVVVADVGSEAAEATCASIRSTGGKAEAVTTDVTDEASIRSLVDGVVARHGQLDVVFCNAGISGYYRRIDEIDLDEWRRVLDVNLTGVMLTAKHAARVMIPRGRGKLILTASIWGLIGSDSVPIADYAASKGGVVNLTRELALQLASHGITVNAIAPGFFDTNIGRDKATATETKQQLREASLALIPTHRRAQPEEIKGTALFLASTASDMVNGHTLVVDAGCVAR